jgi:two-component system, cell cycle response regulator
MRIVLVDSSRTVLHIVTDLIQQGGHDVRSFTDGREALDYLKTDAEVRTLITSMAPHSISGVELCSKARAYAGHRRPLYVILMSSSDEQRNVVQALDNGADDFMHKPPIADELRARLRAADRVTSMQQELIRSATIDYLTGLFNRRAFFERAHEWLALSGAKSAIMFDIDHFKRINDRYGHQSGDIVLRAVADKPSKSEGVVGRLGGEEFCVLLARPLDGAFATAEALRSAVENIRPLLCGDVVTVTSSFGVSEWQQGDTIDRLLARADAALYQAKSAGRNRVLAGNEYSLPASVENWHSVVRTSARAGTDTCSAG